MIEIVQADFSQALHAAALVALMDAYAGDPMGGAAPLEESVRRNLAAALQQRQDAVSILAFDGDLPVGLVNAFEGFSTFRCKALLNIHDVVVIEGYRGRGIAREMLQEVESLARSRGYCKLTLEVLEGNRQAQTVYQRAGFAGYQLDPAKGRALFWEKKLS
ncbi:GNAT family N-acetyltransferase [Sedimenticola sp.]|uniref:GNAT family N-acetyltransferase n=1 Tax=Sedimenticola sp. TaxID=1940285 RepID=UPI003D0AE4D8